MKKLLLILLVVFSAMNVWADEKSDAALSALQQKIADWNAYSVEFSITIGDGQTLVGTWEVSGESYRIDTPWTEIYSDGHTKWEVSRLDREVYVDAVTGKDKTLTQIFDFLTGVHSSKFIGAETINNVSCNHIELSDEDAKFDVFISVSSGLPVRIIHKQDVETRIDIENITPDVVFEPASFWFDRARFPGFEIIDFR